MPQPDAPAPLSPCIGICRIGPDNLCIGCRRSLDEIARWGHMNDEQRRKLMLEVLPHRTGLAP